MDMFPKPLKKDTGKEIKLLSLSLYLSPVRKHFFFKFFFPTFFIYFWDRERQSMNGGGAEREGDTESETQKQAPGSEPSAQSLTRGSNSQTARS